MDTKEIFEEVQATMLRNEPIGRTLFVELAKAGMVISPVLTDDFSTTAAREQTMLQAGRLLGQQFPEDQITELAFVQRAWIHKIMPGGRVPKKPVDQLSTRKEAIVLCHVRIGDARAYTTRYTEIVRSVKGKVTGLITELKPVDMKSDIALDAALTGFENAARTDSQFAMMAALHKVMSSQRVSDAWGILDTKEVSDHAR